MNRLKMKFLSLFWPVGISKSISQAGQDDLNDCIGSWNKGEKRKPKAFSGDSDRRSSIFLGVAVFTGLGLIGTSDNTVGILFQYFGIDEEASFRLSKLVLGVSAGGAIWFLMFGYTELRDGVDVTFKRS